MKIDITKKQAKLLWEVCNQAQNAGMHNIGKLAAADVKVPTSWINETSEEYDNLQDIKVKCKAILYE